MSKARRHTTAPTTGDPELRAYLETLRAHHEGQAAVAGALLQQLEAPPPTPPPRVDLARFRNEQIPLALAAQPRPKPRRYPDYRECNVSAQAHQRDIMAAACVRLRTETALAAKDLRPRIQRDLGRKVTIEQLSRALQTLKAQGLVVKVGTPRRRRDGTPMGGRGDRWALRGGVFL